MLKSKESYANDRAYVRAFFMHNCDIIDYPIDPLQGSFIRVAYPSADQPTCDDPTIYASPKFMFMTRRESSQMYDIDDVVNLLEGLKEVGSESFTNEVYIGHKKTGGKALSVVSSKINFKVNEFNGSSWGTLVTGLTPRGHVGTVNGKLLTPERHEFIWNNLIDSLERIIRKEPPAHEVLVYGKEMMTTFQHYNDTVRRSVVITGRKFEERPDAYIILNSDQERFLIPSNSEFKAVVYISKFLNQITEAAKTIESFGDGGVVTNLGKLNDLNMEYISLRTIPYEGGNRIRVLLNSDRYPGNTKFTYLYHAAKHTDFSNKLKAFCDQFDKL